MKDTLLVNEIFGPTIQGEGRSVGQRAAFLRLGACNLHCMWCDTPHSWRFSDTHPHKWGQVFDKKEELKLMNFSQIASQLSIMDFQVLIVTGGEPLLQKDNLVEFLKYTNCSFYDRVEIETAGTLVPGTLLSLDFVSFNVSPKLENSGNSVEERFNFEALGHFNKSDKAVFKFVVCDEKDFLEIEEMLEVVSIPRWKVYIMAEGEKTEDQLEKMKWVAPLAIEKGFNFTPRLHTLIWGSKRGV